MFSNVLLLVFYRVPRLGGVIVVSERILDVLGRFGAVLLGWLMDALCHAAGENFLLATGVGFVRDGRSGRVIVVVVDEVKSGTKGLVSYCRLRGNNLFSHSDPSAATPPFLPDSPFLALGPFVDVAALALGMNPSSAAFLRRRLRRFLIAWASRPAPVVRSVGDVRLKAVCMTHRKPRRRLHSLGARFQRRGL